MLKFTKYLLTAVLLIVVSTQFATSESSAACYNIYSQPTKHLKNTDIVKPMCNGGSPTGWSSLRSTATYGGGINYKTYNKPGTYLKAVSDFGRYLGNNNGGSIPFQNSTGWYVRTPYGNVSLYPNSTTTGQPTIKWPDGREVIRYIP
ncbi:hypothetical protein ACOI1C_11045 [Bacillus sp. DJP31]|uniref:hypothetical protein n=1 Tax=Bacillus sp. DJP31 TaxID=3409789 RepID=UPI003BB49C0D